MTGVTAVRGPDPRDEGNRSEPVRVSIRRLRSVDPDLPGCSETDGRDGLQIRPSSRRPNGGLRPARAPSRRQSCPSFPLPRVSRPGKGGPRAQEPARRREPGARASFERPMPRARRPLPSHAAGEPTAELKPSRTGGGSPSTRRLTARRRGRGEGARAPTRATCRPRGPVPGTRRSPRPGSP